MTCCNVCCAPVGEPIYRSNGQRSITTMFRLYEQPTVVEFCDQCGHLQTKEIVDPEDYYAHQYSILANSNDEDLLYKVVEGRKVFQVEHRVATLLSKVELPAHAHVLDFGCAKGSVLRRLKEFSESITPYYYDVTDRYVPFWRNASSSWQWAVGRMPIEWHNRFDLVCSFYVLEHVTDPVATVTEMANLIKPGGWLYFLVPNVLANTADLIVADHLQHYSKTSLACVLQRANLDVVEIDDRSHDSAYIVVARRPTAEKAEHPMPAGPSVELRQHYQQMAAFWSQLSHRLRHFEVTHAEGRAACIYGAGFYGNFVASCLGNQQAVTCFVDQNPHLQGRSMLSKPIFSPSQLSPEVEVVYAGLNPAIARSVINDITCWRERELEVFYL